MSKQIITPQPLNNLLKNLCLPTFASCYKSVAESFEQEKNRSFALSKVANQLKAI
ncbi:hypothetical protein [Rickettsia endosymbiont of Urophora cardui]|uniref:hypothetical protein n=1 Tax=Rickettsia endosymbiont of Urophora cardui TaxID=3066265 RepID=UPI00313CFA32